MFVEYKSIRVGEAFENMRKAKRGRKTDMSGTLTLQNLTKKYQEFYAVKNLSLELRESEFLTLLGPSGSGKTTTLKMVAGLEIPTSGKILVDGRDITFLPPNKRGLGMVFQNYALFPHMRVKDNIAFPLRMVRPRVSEEEIQSRVAEILDVVQMRGYEERFPAQLSGGQQQRIALARALVFNPPIVLMDEPLGALDKKLRANMQLEIKRIQQKMHITTIYVTHDQEEALTMSDRIAIMNEGEIVQLDSAKNIYEHPNSAFIADFIGESNFLPVTLAERQGTRMTLKVCSEAGSCFSFEAPLEQTVLAAETKFVIRPEKVRIASALGNEARLKGVVSELVYMGESIKYIVRIDDRFDFSCKEQTKDVNARFAVGDKVELGWEDENARLLT